MSSSALKNGEMTAMRYLCLLEGVMHKMPSSLFKQLAENILSSFAVADSVASGLVMPAWPFQSHDGQGCLGEMQCAAVPLPLPTAAAM